MKIEKMNIEDIKLYENNAKIHTKEQIEQIKNSILEFGNNDPIAIDENNTIIEGHGRYFALKELGFSDVDVIKLTHLDEEKKRAYILVHNKLTMNTDFDFKLLQEELDCLNIDMEQFGFENLEFDDNFIDNFCEEEKNNDFFYFDNDEIIQDVNNNFKKYKDVKEFVKNIMDIPKAKYEFNRLCQGYQSGYNISLLFNPHRLETTTIQSDYSIFSALQDSDVYRLALSKYIVNVFGKVDTECQYYKAMSLGSGGVQYVNEFPPYLARDIYKKYCKNGDKILDPCHGWGGRTIGLAASLLEDIEYIGSDPSKKTFEGLLKLKDFLNLGDNYKYFNLPFEEMQLEENYFDFCFTSPPYYDTERYSQDEKQSYLKNNSYEEWKQNFLYVMLEKILKALKTGGKCLLNVGKVRYSIDEDIIKYLNNKGILVERIKDFKIGGNGIGARTDDENLGEPFLYFEKQ